MAEKAMKELQAGTRKEPIVNGALLKHLGSLAAKAINAELGRNHLPTDLNEAVRKLEMGSVTMSVQLVDECGTYAVDLEVEWGPYPQGRTIPKGDSGLVLRSVRYAVDPVESVRKMFPARQQ